MKRQLSKYLSGNGQSLRRLLVVGCLMLPALSLWVQSQIYLTFDHYPHPGEDVEPWTVTRYGYSVYYSEGWRYQTNWRMTEEYLMTLAYWQLGSDFPILDALTFNKYYRAEEDENGLCYQYIVNDRYGYTFTPCATTPATMAVGDIVYATDVMGVEASIFIWTVTASDIMTLAQANIRSVRRAVKLVSSDNIHYPDIYVIFESPTISMTDVAITADAHLKEHIIKEYLYAQNKQTLGNDEIHITALTPEGNNGNRNSICYDYDGSGALWDDLRRGYSGDRNKEGQGPKMDPESYYNAWKPAYMDCHLSDLFIGNLGTGNTPDQWLTISAEDGSPVPVPLLNSIYNSIGDLDLDFVFDSSNANYHPKGYIDLSGNARSFNLAVSSNGKVLYAYLTSMAVDADTIAEILVDGSLDEIVTPPLEQKWNSDTSRLRRMRIDYKRHTRYGYAEALLNYKGFYQLADDVIKATVALRAWNTPRYQGSLLAMPLVNNTFDVRFLRPLSAYPRYGMTIIDSDGEQVIRVSDLAPEYADWRDSWKYIPNYEQYYAPNGKSNINFHFAYGFANGQNISSDPNVTTDLGGNTTPVPLGRVTSQIDFAYYDTPQDWYRNGMYANCVYMDSNGKMYDEPVLVYRNRSLSVGTFHVYIPAMVEYYWGRFYNTITITVQGKALNIEGDVNSDGVVDVADIASIISVMAGQGTYTLQRAADINKDGIVDVADIAAVIDIMASTVRPCQ